MSDGRSLCYKDRKILVYDKIRGEMREDERRKDNKQHSSASS